MLFRSDKAAIEKVAFLRKQYGLDKPFLEQYAVWVGLWKTERGFSGLLQGDWGWSFEYDMPVSKVIGDRMLLSFILNVTVILFTWTVAFPIGVYAATHQYSWGDHGLTLLGYVGLATPNFLLALVLMYFANVEFGLSIGGIMDPEFLDQPWSWAKFGSVLTHLWIPVIVIGTSGTAAMIRRLRANLLDSTKILDEAALDPYEFQRDAYLQRRRNLVYDGNPPPEKEDDIPEIKTKPRAEGDEDAAKPVGASIEAPRAELPGAVTPVSAPATEPSAPPAI